MNFSFCPFLWFGLPGRLLRPERSKSHLRLSKQGLRLCNPMLRQCTQPFVPLSAKTFCALSPKHFGPDQLIRLPSLAAWFAILEPHFRRQIPCTHFEKPPEDFCLARKSRIKDRFLMHAEIPGSGITLSFLSLFFGKLQGKPPKNKDLLSLPHPWNPWKRRERRSKKQGMPRRGKKNKEFQKTKERKDRVGIRYSYRMSAEFFALELKYTSLSSGCLIKFTGISSTCEMPGLFQESLN